jgi:hypothetical protein
LQGEAAAQPRMEWYKIEAKQSRAKFNRMGKLGNSSCKPSTHKLIKGGHKFETMDIDSCTNKNLYTVFSLIATKEINNNIETKKKSFKNDNSYICARV